MYVMYDIACTLQKHLKVRLLNDVSYHLLIALPISKSGCVKLSGRDDLLNQVHLCLPSFHSYVIFIKASLRKKYTSGCLRISP